MTHRSEAIGGYFELELPPVRIARYPDAYTFQSARAALLALLRARTPERVWVPHYICDAMLAPFKATGTRIAFYSLTRNFEIADDIRLGRRDWILYVNYFGLCTAVEQRIIDKYGSDRVVCDHAQAFFAAPQQCMATIYSPRKFFGVPDGGLLITRIRVDRPTVVQEVSLQSVAHLIRRLSVDAESGYADYLAAEKIFDDIEPKIMSVFSKRVLSSVDLAQVAIRRRANFDFLNSILSSANRLTLEYPVDACVPLCYPLLVANSSLREYLRSKRVFTATYWPEVLARSPFESFEAEMADKLVAIPCDQRYDESNLQEIADLIANYR